MLDQALGLFDHHVRDLHVPVGGLVEGGGDDLCLHILLHVGDFFRTLVDQQDDQHTLGVILADRVGELLHQNRLARLGRGDDQAALALADGGEQVHHAHRQVAGGALEADALVGIPRLEVVKGDPVLGLLGFLVVDALDLEQRQVPLALLGRPHLPHDGIAGAQIEPLDLAGRDVDVVGAVEVVPVLAAEESVAFGQDLEDAFAADDRILIEQRLLDTEDQVLLAEARVVGDVELFCQCMQFSYGLLFELGDIHRCGTPLSRTPLGSGPPVDRRASLRGGQMCSGSELNERPGESGAQWLVVVMGLPGEVTRVQGVQQYRNRAPQRQGRPWTH